MICTAASDDHLNDRTAVSRRVETARGYRHEPVQPFQADASIYRQLAKGVAGRLEMFVSDYRIRITPAADTATVVGDSVEITLPAGAGLKMSLTSGGADVTERMRPQLLCSIDRNHRIDNKLANEGHTVRVVDPVVSWGASVFRNLDCCLLRA